jgi:hypothetical protein
MWRQRKDVRLFITDGYDIARINFYHLKDLLIDCDIIQ